MLTFFSFKWFLIYLITTPDIFLNQTHFARLGIFHLELGKKHTFWLWEWGRISAPNFGDREPCRANKSSRLNSFALRNIHVWNSLPSEIVNSKTVVEFKTKLDKLWSDILFDLSEVY